MGLSVSNCGRLIGGSLELELFLKVNVDRKVEVVSFRVEGFN